MLLLYICLSICVLNDVYEKFKIPLQLHNDKSKILIIIAANCCCKDGGKRTHRNDTPM